MSLKGEVLRSTTAYVKKLYETFGYSRGNYTKSDKTSVRAKDQKFQNGKNLGLWRKKLAHQTV